MEGRSSLGKNEKKLKHFKEKNNWEKPLRYVKK